MARARVSPSPADPDKHFDKVHKCTPSNFEGIVKKEVDAGKSLFVRWIASAG